MASERLTESRDRFDHALANLRAELPPETCEYLNRIHSPDDTTLASLEDREQELQTLVETLVIATSVKSDSRSVQAKSLLRRWFRASYYFIRLALGVAGVGAAV